MKWILKILIAPVILLIDLLTLVCMGIISFSAIPLRIVSGIIALLGTAVLMTYSPKNGMILLTIAFLISPMAISLIAVWLLSGLQSILRIQKISKKSHSGVNYGTGVYMSHTESSKCFFPLTTHYSLHSVL